jgi:predicted SAM-dependent methyltransferase
MSNRDQLYSSTNFQEFYFRAGDKLPFADGHFDYIFSEHFFEHLFLDEAVALFLEARRILRPGGVIRTVVPDADLRTYEPPEPLGFPDRQMPFTDPTKHKTRWCVYSLCEVLRLVGLLAVPLRYCTKEGEFVCVDPSQQLDCYEACADREIVADMSHVSRMNSLLVDGIKPPIGSLTSPGGQRHPLHL